LQIPPIKNPPIQNHIQKQIESPKDMHPVILDFIASLQYFTYTGKKPC